VLDGYLPSRDWPEVKASWASIMGSCEAINRWQESSITPRTLALEHWLCEQLGWRASALDGLSCWPLIRDATKLEQLSAAGTVKQDRILLTPCHFYVRLDHVGVTSLSDKALSQDEAHALLASLSDDIASWSNWFESTITIQCLDPMHWLMHFDRSDVDLEGCTLALAEGLNVEQYLAQGGKARTWRRVLNQIQMIWHEHPVNLARSQAGLLPINALWLGGRLQPGSKRVKRYFSLKSQSDYLRGLERYIQASADQQVDDLLLLTLDADQLKPDIVEHGLRTLLSAIASAPAHQALELLLCSEHVWEHYRIRRPGQILQGSLLERIFQWFVKR
jgi:hypothetical protein